MSDKVKIFISYARVDQDKVLPLYQRLKDEGFDPWIDREHLLPGVRWRVAIEQAMRDSDFFLLCLSAQSSNRRGFIQREINTALDLWEERLQDDIYFIPLRLEECDIPARVDEFQCVNWFEADGWDRLLKALHYQAENSAKAGNQPRRCQSLNLREPRRRQRPNQLLSSQNQSRNQRALLHRDRNRKPFRRFRNRFESNQGCSFRR